MQQETEFVCLGGASNAECLQQTKHSHLTLEISDIRRTGKALHAVRPIQTNP